MILIRLDLSFFLDGLIHYIYYFFISRLIMIGSLRNV